jgi:gluconolactonase
MVPAGAPGKILAADHGGRAVVELDLATRQRRVLAGHYEGKRFNSPNDLVRRSDGVIFFTDPPYGLKDLNDSPHKEQPHNGVYRLDLDGRVTLLDDSLTFPNGIALSPDETTLYVANSDPEMPIWRAYELDAAGDVLSRWRFASAADLVSTGAHGLPDGMAVDTRGNLYATGPGGVLVFNPRGQRLGLIATGSAIANCAFGEDGHTLFLTAHDRLARVRTRALGLEYGGSGYGGSGSEPSDTEE